MEGIAGISLSSQDDRLMTSEKNLYLFKTSSRNRRACVGNACRSEVRPCMKIERCIVKKDSWILNLRDMEVPYAAVPEVGLWIGF